MSAPGTIILSRPDALGDAVVTLSAAGWLKAHAPGTRIVVVCKEYARAAWAYCAHVDRIITLEELTSLGERGAALELEAVGANAIVHVFPDRDVARWAKAAGIPRRIGTSHRWWHWTTCNERVAFSRKRSDLHEAQLNIKLLAPLGLPMPAAVAELIPHLGLMKTEPSERVQALLPKGKKHLVVHPLLGSGVGWGLKNYADLIAHIDPEEWHVSITGTEREAQHYAKELPLQAPNVSDLGGKLTLEELMMVIGASDAFVSASTGPLHIAAALGVRAVGLFSMRRPIFPTRWAPIGKDAHALVFDPSCTDCAAGRMCDCITRIPVARVLDLLK